MEVNDKVKEMSVKELKDLRSKIRVQFILGQVSMDDYMRGDLELMNLVLIKEAKKTIHDKRNKV